MEEQLIKRKLKRLVNNHKNAREDRLSAHKEEKMWKAKIEEYVSGLSGVEMDDEDDGDSGPPPAPTFSVPVSTATPRAVVTSKTPQPKRRAVSPPQEVEEEEEEEEEVENDAEDEDEEEESEEIEEIPYTQAEPPRKPDPPREKPPQPPKRPHENEQVRGKFTPPRFIQDAAKERKKNGFLVSLAK